MNLCPTMCTKKEAVYELLRQPLIVRPAWAITWRCKSAMSLVVRIIIHQMAEIIRLTKCGRACTTKQKSEPTPIGAMAGAEKNQ